MTIENPVLVEVERSGFVESRHRGTIAALDTGGGIAIAVGETDLPFFPRSANKPFQAIAMVRHGLGLRGELLALSAASHSGEDFHVAGVRKILARSGLTEDALQCPPSLPLDEAVATELIAGGGGPTRLHMNCSGKHAAMLATCVTNGWPTDSYLSPDHPLQQSIADVVAELAGEKIAATGVDGCGAPLLAVSPAGAARAFRALMLAVPGTPEHLVASVMRAHPEWTSGTHRAECRLMRAVPGLLMKSGAEGVDGFALADGRAAIVKIDDGSMRARTPVSVAVLRALGVDRVPGVDLDVIDGLATTPVHGGGEVVGAIRAKVTNITPGC